MLSVIEIWQGDIRFSPLVLAVPLLIKVVMILGEAARMDSGLYTHSQC